MNDMECEVLITQDEAWRRGSTVPLKRTPTRRWPTRRRSRESARAPPHGQRGLDATTAATSGGTTVVPDDAAGCPCEPMDSEDLLFLMYTSGTTAKPKGIVHTTGGYLVGRRDDAPLHLRPEASDDVYWCAADIGWITGHSYIVYGPLCNGATSVMYEGTPDYPGQGPLVGDRRALRRTILYTAPTAIRAHMKWGRRVRAEARPLVAAPARDRSVSRSTRRPGSGTTSTSAASAARSSTRGGRRRRG